MSQELLNKDFQGFAVSVVFAGGSVAYTYKSHDSSIKNGDYVVVFARSTLKIARVASVAGPLKIQRSSVKFSWIVDKINFTEYNERTAADDARREELTP